MDGWKCISLLKMYLHETWVTPLPTAHPPMSCSQWMAKSNVWRFNRCLRYAKLACYIRGSAFYFGPHEKKLLCSAFCDCFCRLTTLACRLHRAFCGFHGFPTTLKCFWGNNTPFVAFASALLFVPCFDVFWYPRCWLHFLRIAQEQFVLLPTSHFDGLLSYSSEVTLNASAKCLISCCWHPLSLPRRTEDVLRNTQRLGKEKEKESSASFLRRRDGDPTVHRLVLGPVHVTPSQPQQQPARCALRAFWKKKKVSALLSVRGASPARRPFCHHFKSGSFGDNDTGWGNEELNHRLV